jgi:hypothetical protein
VGGAFAVALVGLVVAVVFEGLARWVGTAAVLAVAPLGWRVVAMQPWWQERRPRLPLVLVLALAVVLLGPLLQGDPPASRDHGIHYFQVHLLVNELLPSGRLWGWSPSLNNGYAFGESYPVLGYLWMAAAHLLSFGAISLRTSYAWGLASLWMLSAAVAWWLASLVTRELSPIEGAAAEHEPDGSAEVLRARSPAEIAGWAGLVAAALWLVDPGASRQGGWNYLLYHGVWPQLLAATLWAASLGLTWRAFADPRPRRLALAVLALGGSLWAHPFGLLTAGASAGAWALLVLLGRQRWPGPWRVWLVVHGGAALLGAAWLAVFFGAADSMGRTPVPWMPLAELGEEIVHGRLFAGQWGYAAPLALVGGAVVLRRGGTLGWAVVGLVAGLLVLGSEDAITVLRLDLLVSGFKNLQFPRYAIPLKPLWFALAGVGLGGLLAWWARVRRGEPVPLRLDAAAWARRAAVGLLLAPLVATLAPEAERLIARPVAALDTLPASGRDQAEAELLAALRQEVAALPPERPLVVAVMRSGMGGGTYPIFAVTDVGGRLVLDSHIPTINVEHVLHRRPAVYASLGVTHVIHDLPVPEEEKGLAALLTEVGRYGPFRLERFTPPRGRGPRIAELEKSLGVVDVRVDEVERLELDVTGVEPGTTLVLGRAPHHRWVITLDGEPLEPRAVRLDKGGLVVVGVELPGPGHVVVQYEVKPGERRAGWISAAMLLMCLVGIVWSGPPIAEAEPGPRARAIAWAVVGVGSVVLVVGVAWRQAAKLERTWAALALAELDPEPDDDHLAGFMRDLVIDDEIDVTVAPAQVCNGLLGKDVHEGCSEDAHAPGPSFLFLDPYLYRCLRFSVPPDGEAKLQFPALPDDDTVVLGVLVRHKQKGSGKKLLFGSRWITQPVLDEQHVFVLDREQHGKAPTLGLRNSGKAIEQVCVAAALVRRP